MEFEKRKAATLAALSSTVTDKSPKGSLDTPIIPLLDAINQHPSYFTTSSCSGRISILSQPSTTSNLPKKKARGGSWLFVSHELADSDSIVPLLFPSDPNSDPTCPCDLVFRFEPLIIAIECKDLASAQNLVAAAISSGFRESGITSAGKRVIIAIRCSIRMEVPLGNTQKLMVSPEYVRYLVGVANEKMEANMKRTNGFFLALLGNGFAGSTVAGTGGQVLVNGGEGGAECGVDGDCSSVLDPNDGSEGGGANGHIGSVGGPCCSLSTAQISIIGEPVEKLFLWGHSSCRMDNALHQILVFGGFGGMGRHARKNDCFVLDPSCGEVEAVKAGVAPSPRLGHTSSLIGDCMFVIGGRADPVNILSDVWAFSTSKKEWKLLECTGSVLPPRHRHAATVVGSEIYVFGGLSNDLIYSSLHVLDTVTLQWRELPVNGEWPCARHSHSMVTYASKIFMFGGYNGEKALGDLYSFDVKACQWKKEKTEGRCPHARFSHSMFVYKNYIGVIGGCPVKQHHHELALLDLELQTWKYVVLNSVGKYLFVRSTASVIGDDLVIIGGGAACYAFGTKFSEPVKINLLPLISLDNNILHLKMRLNLQNKGLTRARNDDFKGLQSVNAPTITVSPNLNTGAGTTGVDDRQQVIDSHGVLRLAKLYAKLGKDTLKKFGWLDLGRKAYSLEDGMYICFPVTEIFCALFHEKQHHSEDSLESHESFSEGISLNELSSSTALGLLKNCGATILADDILELKRAPKSPFKIMSEAVTSLIQSKGLSEQLLEELPARWDRLGDILVLPVTSFKDSVWDSIAKELWPTVAKSLNARRLARQGRVAPTGTRDSTLEILVGENGWVDHCENGVHYSFDATKCMFSWGNLSEKLRMGRLDCTDEVIVDLFAGIGYYVLPFLVRANAKLVYACEWNPHAVEALRRNLQANSVSNRCIVLEGDNKTTAPKGVADRVCLGLLPTSESSWATAVRALKKEGGVMHVHGNVKDTEEGLWTEHVRKSINEMATSQGYCWQVSIKHVQRVKWYAPHIRHLVADVSCRQIQR